MSNYYMYRLYVILHTYYRIRIVMDSAAEIESNYANDNEPTQASVSPNNW